MVDQKKTLLLVCSLAEMEVAGKSCRKKFLVVAMASVRLNDDCNATGV